MSDKKKKKNPYAFFMDSRRGHYRAAGHGLSGGYQDLAELCSKDWENLPEPEKQRFVDKAKVYNARLHEEKENRRRAAYNACIAAFKARSTDAKPGPSRAGRSKSSGAKRRAKRARKRAFEKMPVILEEEEEEDQPKNLGESEMQQEEIEGQGLKALVSTSFEEKLVEPALVAVQPQQQKRGWWSSYLDDPYWYKPEVVELVKQIPIFVYPIEYPLPGQGPQDYARFCEECFARK